VEALILAAGIARRLESGTPKCLLAFDRVPLLHRHLAHLARLGVRRATIVVGYRAAEIEQSVARLVPAPSIEVRFVLNPRFREGSILSLREGLAAIGAGAAAVTVMDADVLYEPLVLERLISASGTCFLMDETHPETGEEMMLAARAGRIHRIARCVGRGWDETGEGVGFLRVDASDLLALRTAVDATLAACGTALDYEVAIDAFLADRPARYVRVGGLAWTEIDFPEDVLAAERDVLPIVRLREQAVDLPPVPESAHHRA
jgi:choline kinase